MDLSEYEYLWTTEKDDWVLAYTSYGYGIVNKTEQTVLLVEDDELEKALTDKMLSVGCRVYDDINDAYKDVPGRTASDDDTFFCEKCGHELDPYIHGSCCGVTCPNCGWGWATTYIEPIMEDSNIYHIILETNDISLKVTRIVSDIACCNYIQARKIIEKAPVEIFCGQAVEVLKAKEKLEAAGIRFGIEPEFPY